VLTSGTTNNTNLTFKGNFNGNGYTIYNMTVTSTKMSYYSYIGLFGVMIGGKVENVHLENYSINLSKRVDAGAIVGRADGGTVIEGCSSSGTLIADVYGASSGSFAGGIVGRGYTVTVRNCTSAGTLALYYDNSAEFTYAGGIMGYGHTVSISNCYTSASANSYAYTSKAVAGGILGYAEISSTVKSCVVTGSGKVYGRDGGYAGTYIGYVKASSSAINCYSSLSTDKSFYTATLGWSETVWYLGEVESGKAPTLKKA
jgi:hypothetical protein